MSVYLRYVGQGTSLHGVPARDLTRDEAFEHGSSRLIASGLYEAVEEKQVYGSSANKAVRGGSSNKTAEEE